MSTRSLRIAVRLLGLCVTLFVAGFMSLTLTVDATLLCSSNPACGSCDGLRASLAVNMILQAVLMCCAAGLLVPWVARRLPGRRALQAAVAVPAISVCLFLSTRTLAGVAFCTPTP